MQITGALAELDGSMDDVVRTRMYVTHIDRDQEAVGQAHARYFSVIKPVATMVEVSRLIDPHFLVEIEVTARVAPS